MTRLDLLKHLIARARAHGFEFRRWYTHRLHLPWINAEAALKLLDAQRRYYALIFSHEFAHAFWAPGSDILLALPAQTFDSVMPDGTVRTVERRQHVRRSARRDAWRYHLKQMALAEDPLRYLRRFLPLEEELDPEPEHGGRLTSSRSPGERSAKTPPKRSSAKPLPSGPPAFLQRPYKGVVARARTP